MSLTVLEPGLLTTVQDLGRVGYRHLGFVTSGAMDSLACKISNIMLNNAPINTQSNACLEFTLLGPTLQFKKPCVVYLGGAMTHSRLDDEPVENNALIQIESGQTLKVGPVIKGCRGYLAIKGGFDIDPQLNSRSTYLRGEVGGYQGRALMEGDELAYEHWSKPLQQLLSISPSFDLTDYLYPNGLHPAPEVRFIRGQQFDWFSQESMNLFCQQTYTVDQNSDRMGYRLNGSPLIRENQQEMLTEGVTVGTIQIPADGNPIILMADSQPTGGYPKAGQIISVDLPKVAQLKPGDALTFKEVSLAEAQTALLKQQQDLYRLTTAVQHQWGKITND